MIHPVIILHGAFGSAEQLEPVKTALLGRRLEAHSMNLSGHGGTAFQSQFGIEQFAKDVLSEMNSLNLTTANIFGYSMGGYVALWLAKNHPHRIANIITLGTKFDWSEESASKEIKKLDPVKIIEKVPAFANILAQRHAPNDWKELMHKTSGMMMELGRNPQLTPEVLKSIQQPVCICLGDQDDMADKSYSQEVASFLPNGKFLALKNTPHPIEKVDLEKLVDILVTEFTD